MLILEVLLVVRHHLQSVGVRVRCLLLAAVRLLLLCVELVDDMRNVNIRYYTGNSSTCLKVGKVAVWHGDLSTFERGGDSSSGSAS